jgi:hypothetical protein
MTAGEMTFMSGSGFIFSTMDARVNPGAAAPTRVS